MAGHVLGNFTSKPSN